MTSSHLAIRSDLSVSAILAGMISTLISFAGPLVIVFQAAQHLRPDLLQSWVWTISVGSGVLGITLSLAYRVPVIIAWSAPGSALLITLLPTVSFEEAVGAYLVTSLTVALIGATGTFDWLVKRLPAGISAAMLAGILFNFTVKMFGDLPAHPLLVGTMFATFFAVRRTSPRYAIVAVLVVGVLCAKLTGQLAFDMPALHMTIPVWTTPSYSWQAIINIALPLAVVALTGQWVPGIAVLRGSGYAEPGARPLMVWTSIVSAILAPFGCHGLNLAAITATICTQKEAHADPRCRYVAGVSGGILYLILGCFSATVLALFATLPPELIAALAGLALFPTVATALAAAMAEQRQRDSALVTFIVSASGTVLFGLGAAFWSLIFGMIVHALLHAGRPLPAESFRPSGR